MLKIMLHYYCHPYRLEGYSPGFHAECVARLVEFEMLAPYDDYWIPTRKGKAFVNLVVSTPIPEPAWVDPRDGKIIETQP